MNTRQPAARWTRASGSAAFLVYFANYILGAIGLDSRLDGGKDVFSRLHYAARYADGSVVRILIASGTDPKAVNSDGWKPWVLGFNNRKLRADAGAFKLLDE